jgi:hypothetical protein
MNLQNSDSNHTVIVIIDVLPSIQAERLDQCYSPCKIQKDEVCPVLKGTTPCL